MSIVAFRHHYGVSESVIVTSDILKTRRDKEKRSIKAVAPKV